MSETVNQTVGLSRVEGHRRHGSREPAVVLLSAGALFLLAASSLPAAETALVQLGSAMKYQIPASDALGTTWTGKGFGEAGFPIQLLFSLFGGMGIDCHDAIDANDDGSLDVADAVRILEYLFQQGPALPPPFPAVGPDPTEDPLDCGRG